MLRIYNLIASEHVASLQQMLFLVGPRQVGKTTISKQLAKLSEHSAYVNWDDEDDQQLLLNGTQHLLAEKKLLQIASHKNILVLDEIHKFKNWRNYIKGLYDKHHEQLAIIVTGSSQLDSFKSTGDSLMGRYLLYKVHPLSLAELSTRELRDEEIALPIAPDKDALAHLIKFGGFPDPFLKGSDKFHVQWTKLRTEQLFHDELRSLTRIHQIASIKLMALILQGQIGHLLNYSALAAKVKVTTDTIINWVNTLKAFYYCYTIAPWSHNISRSLIKQPKVYLWNWSEITDIGARHENLVASHLMKAIDLWTDRGLGVYQLFFVRDKEQNEVDFLVTKNNIPWFLVEVKSANNNRISSSLYLMHKQLNTKHAFQVCFNSPYVEKNCFDYSVPVIVPASTFLSQLV